MFKVHTNFGGCVCVVQLSEDFDRYIEVKKDVRYPGFAFAEYVRSGFVRNRDHSTVSNAPEMVLRMATKRSDHVQCS